MQTTENGTVTSNIFSGNVAGNLSIEARIERPEVALTIRSKPILLTIHGGFPDLAHFSIAADIFNFEGLAINGNRSPITVIVGDKFSNPAKPGTPVYFNTTGGVIQGSGVTNDDGEVEVDLISGDPRPSDGMTVDGDVDISIPNTVSSGEGVTQFSFTAQDSDEESNERQEVSIRIAVETPGGFTASKTITGFKVKGL